MQVLRPIAVVLLCGPALAACGNSKDAETIYVLTPPQKASRFTQDLAAIVSRHGLSPNLGRSTDDRGHTYWVIEADGRWTHVWGTNMPLSGHEDPAICGRYPEGHADPGQYIVTIDHGLVYAGLNHLLARISPGGPRAVASEISNEIRTAGYTVRKIPLLCSPLSKTEAR